MKTIPEDEYAVLVEKAAAWDSYIRRRLVGADTAIADLEVHCVKGKAEIALKNHTAVTPYGDVQAITTQTAHGFNTFNLEPGDVIQVSHQIVLTLK